MITKEEHEEIQARCETAKTVDGSDCMECCHFDAIEGSCTRHGYDAMELRDGSRECNDYELDEFYKRLDETRFSIGGDSE